MTTGYPPFDGTQSCQDVTDEDAAAFVATPGAGTAGAKAVCAGCRFLGPCGDYALTHDVHGLWGGLDDDDRAHVRTRRHLLEPRPITEELDEFVTATRTTTTTRRTAA